MQAALSLSHVLKQKGGIRAFMREHNFNEDAPDHIDPQVGCHPCFILDCSPLGQFLDSHNIWWVATETWMGRGVTRRPLFNRVHHRAKAVWIRVHNIICLVLFCLSCPVHSLLSQALDNYVRSSAGYCIITYILGIGIQLPPLPIQVLCIGIFCTSIFCSVCILLHTRMDAVKSSSQVIIFLFLVSVQA